MCNILLDPINLVKKAIFGNPSTPGKETYGSKLSYTARRSYIPEASDYEMDRTEHVTLL